jgi:hypothetical protein
MLTASVLNDVFNDTLHAIVLGVLVLLVVGFAFAATREPA